MTEQELQAVKNNYGSTDWESFRDDAGDLLQIEIDIYDAVVIEGIPALIAEVERLRGALKTIAFTTKFKLQCEIENYAELVLECRESEWVESPFDASKPLSKVRNDSGNFDKNKSMLLASFYALGTDVMTIENAEYQRLQAAITNIKRICEQSENSDTRYIKRILDELEGE